MGDVVEFAEPTSIEQQARQWLIRMDGDEPLTESERKALKDWLNSNPAHREELIRLSRFWNQANVLTELAGLVHPQESEHKASRGIGKLWSALVASVAVFVSILTVYFGLQSLNRSTTRSYETVTGDQKTVFLADGSSIKLNTDSQVEVTYTLQERQIRLSRGEAFFTVASDANRVFEVHVANSVVRAIGTAFAIHLEGRAISVVVTKGAVEVSDTNSAAAVSDQTPGKDTSHLSVQRQLVAGEVAYFYSGSGHIEVRQLSEHELQRRLAWQDGYLAFSGEPLAEVVAELNRYSTKKLSIGEPKLESIPIGGNFKIGDLDGILGLLHSTFGIRGRKEGLHHIVLEPEQGD